MRKSWKKRPQGRAKARTGAGLLCQGAKATGEMKRHRGVVGSPDDLKCAPERRPWADRPFPCCGLDRRFRRHSEHLPGDLEVFRRVDGDGMILRDDRLEGQPVRQKTELLERLDGFEFRSGQP